MKINNKVRRLFYYFKFLDEVNAKILETLGKHGSRNITALARSVNLPVTTVRFRFRKMMKDWQVKVMIHPNLCKLGLAKAFMIAESPLGRHKKLLKAIRNTGYWTYIIRCYGKYDGYCAYFAFPAKHMSKLEEYWLKAKKLQVTSHYKFFWITNSYLVPPNFSWYDFKRKEWNFRWKECANDIINQSEKLPEVLRDPPRYNIEVDKKDLLIIKELEKNEAIEFKELAKIVRITPQGVGARYRNHILQRNLIASYIVDVYLFPLEISDLYVFIIDFPNKGCLAKFANACREQPFAVSYAKVIGKNSLIINIHIPKMEFPKLIELLNWLYEQKIIKDFFYVTLDPTSFQRQTISYEFFENGKWIYNHKEKLKRLERIARNKIAEI